MNESFVKINRAVRSIQNCMEYPDVGPKNYKSIFLSYIRSGVIAFAPNACTGFMEQQMWIIYKTAILITITELLVSSRRGAVKRGANNRQGCYLIEIYSFFT